MIKKTIVGLVEKVKLNGSEEKHKEIIARIDTGATKSSVDLELASELRLGPVVRSMLIKSAHGSKLRPVIEAEIEICGHKITSQFTLADRAHMKYPVLIGQNILKQGFLIDPAKESPEGKEK
jgi:hypothetical protein